MTDDIPEPASDDGPAPDEGSRGLRAASLGAILGLVLAILGRRSRRR